MQLIRHRLMIINDSQSYLGWQVPAVCPEERRSYHPQQLWCHEREFKRSVFQLYLQLKMLGSYLSLQQVKHFLNGTTLVPMSMKCSVTDGKHCRNPSLLAALFIE